MKLIIIIAPAVAYITFCASAAIYCITNGKLFKSFFHDKLGWHVVPEENESYFDGCSFHGKCAICGKECMQDSQGNWF